MPSEEKSVLPQTVRRWWRQLGDRIEAKATAEPVAPAARAGTPGRITAADCRTPSVLILSHTDPQVSVSGVDRFVRAEINALEEAGFSVWILSPHAGLTPRTYTWRRGSEMIADGCDPAFVQAEVEALLATGCVRATAIHHLLGFEPALLEALGLFSGSAKLLLYLHDEHLLQFEQLSGEFSFLARNFGWDGPTFAGLLPRLQAAVNRLASVADCVILPSLALQEHLAAALIRAGIAPEKCRVVPEVSFTHYRDKDPVSHTRPRLAYLGHALPNKGWVVWQELLRDPHIRENFDLFHIGDSGEGGPAGVVEVPYSTCDGNPYASVALLHDHEIDMVLLWSTVVESASYTMAEAHAAGIPVLTSSASGNIAASIKRGDVSGQVLDDEHALQEFLLDSAAVDRLVAAGAKSPLLWMHHESFLRQVLEERI